MTIYTDNSIVKIKDCLNDLFEQEYFPAYGKYGGEEVEKQVRETFEKKYRLISLEDFKEEVLLECALIEKELELTQKMLKDILEEDGSNESIRKTFNRSKKKHMDLHIERQLDGISSEVIDNVEQLKEARSTIFNMHEKIMEITKAHLSGEESSISIRDQINLEELEKVLTSLDYVEHVAHNHQYNVDDFLENILQDDFKRLETANIGKKEYTPIMILMLKKEFFTKIDKSRSEEKKDGRTKETIFDWLFNNNEDKKIRTDIFIDRYIKALELYKDILGEEGCNFLIYYYALERDYNLLYYHLISSELVLINLKKDRDLFEKIKELSGLGCYINRSKILTSIANRLSGLTSFQRERLFLQIKTELEELTYLKYKFSKRLLEYQVLRENRISDVIDELIREEIKLNIQKEIEDSLQVPSNNTYFMYLKELVLNNLNLIRNRKNLIITIEDNKRKAFPLDEWLGDNDDIEEDDDLVFRLSDIVFGEVDDI